MPKIPKLIVIIASSLALLGAGTVVTLTLLGRQTPLSSLYSDLSRRVQLSSCQALADKVLKANHVRDSAYRCSTQHIAVSGSNKSVSRVHVVVGAVEPQWEFECGYLEVCEKYNGWFDSSGQPFNITDPPVTANQDPAVYTLGCGEADSSSVYDIAIKPKLVYRQGKYWWQTDYNNTLTSSQNPLCRVSGTSLLGYKEALSSVKVQYLFNTSTCDPNRPSPCQTAKALMTNSAEACKSYNPSMLEAPTTTDLHSAYDYYCTSNYIARTADRSLCDTEANYGKIICNNLVFIKQL